MSQPEGCRLDFVDTNVVLDALIPKRQFHDSIEGFLKMFHYKELKIVPAVMNELNEVIKRINNVTASALEEHLLRNPGWIEMDREDRLEYLGQIRDKLVDDIVARVNSRDAELAQGYVTEFVDRALEEYRGRLSLINSKDDLKLAVRSAVSLAHRLLREDALTLFDFVTYPKYSRAAAFPRESQIFRALVTGSGGKFFSTKGDALIVAQLLTLLEYPPPVGGQCVGVRVKLWTRDEELIKRTKRLKDLDMGITPRPRFEDLLVRHPLRDDI